MHEDCDLAADFFTFSSNQYGIVYFSYNAIHEKIFWTIPPLCAVLHSLFHLLCDESAADALKSNRIAEF